MNLDMATLARLGVLQGTEALLPSRGGRPVLGLGWPELEKALPERGLPRGVVEIAAMPRLDKAVRAQDKTARALESMRGGATSIAIAAMSAVHAADEKAWCAWITPSEANGQATPSLYAPALERAHVDLERLLVVRPSPKALARTIVKVASSGAFELVVIDVPHLQAFSVEELRASSSPFAPRGGSSSGATRPTSSNARPNAGSSTGREGTTARSTRASRWDGGALVARKLALAAEEAGTTSLLLTNALEERSVPWPVALRLEVERRPEALSIRVTKDRRGNHLSSQHVVRLAS